MILIPALLFPYIRRADDAVVPLTKPRNEV